MEDTKEKALRLKRKTTSPHHHRFTFDEVRYPSSASIPVTLNTIQRVDQLDGGMPPGGMPIPEQDPAPPQEDTAPPQQEERPTPRPPQRPRCQIQVRYTAIGDVFIADYYHAYVLVTKADGTRYYLRGGPENSVGGESSATATGGGVSAGSGASRSDSSNSSNSSSPGASRAERGGSTGPWGRIVTEFGAYVPGTIDYETGNPPSVNVFVSSADRADEMCERYYQSMQTSMRRIDGANIPYNPLFQNSNSAAHQAVQDAGFPRPVAPVWAPGADTTL